jgi:methyl-accepting chemotaxis protein
MSQGPSLVVQDRLRTDRQMFFLLLAHVPVVGLLVPTGYDTYAFAIVASVLVGALASISYGVLRGTRACSAVFAMCLMLFSAVMIQAQMGRIEMHFHIFAALALVIIYRDWLPVVVGAAVIAVHHLVLTGLQLSEAALGQMPLMVFNYGCSWSIAMLHAAFVVFEASILVFFAIKMGHEQTRSYEMIDAIRLFDSEKSLAGRVDSQNGGRSGMAFNSLMEQFGLLISEIRELSGRLRGYAADLGNVSQRTDEIVDDQHGQVEQAASAMEQMTATIQEVTRSAQEAAEASESASEAVHSGSSNIESSVRLTESTESALADSAKMVNQLVEQVQSIGSVIASIHEISDQTNLLALNAAIEAARAGDHGRGFSVVADEVRTLSRRTQEFTDEIRTTIDELSRVSEATLASIEMGQTRSRETSHSVREAGEAFSTIESAIRSLSEINAHVASASEQQATTSVEVNDSIQRVSGRNGEVVSQAGRARELAQELQNALEEVDQLVRIYRTDES